MFENEFLKHVATEFAKLFGELLILFVGISFIVALLQVYISPAKIKKLLTATTFTDKIDTLLYRHWMFLIS